jgi:hypothetical protein
MDHFSYFVESVTHRHKARLHWESVLYIHTHVKSFLYKQTIESILKDFDNKIYLVKISFQASSSFEAYTLGQK